MGEEFLNSIYKVAKKLGFDKLDIAGIVSFSHEISRDVCTYFENKGKPPKKHFYLLTDPKKGLVKVIQESEINKLDNLADALEDGDHLIIVDEDVITGRTKETVEKELVGLRNYKKVKFLYAAERTTTDKKGKPRADIFSKITITSKPQTAPPSINVKVGDVDITYYPGRSVGEFIEGILKFFLRE